MHHMLRTLTTSALGVVAVLALTAPPAAAIEADDQGRRVPCINCW